MIEPEDLPGEILDFEQKSLELQKINSGENLFWEALKDLEKERIIKAELLKGFNRSSFA